MRRPAGCPTLSSETANRAQAPHRTGCRHDAHRWRALHADRATAKANLQQHLKAVPPQQIQGVFTESGAIQPKRRVSPNRRRRITKPDDCDCWPAHCRPSPINSASPSKTSSPRPSAAHESAGRYRSCNSSSNASTHCSRRSSASSCRCLTGC